MKTKVAIVGGGGHSKVLASVINSTDEYEFVGYTDVKHMGVMMERHYLGDDQEFLLKFKSKVNHMKLAFGIGKVASKDKRLQIYNTYKLEGFQFPPMVAKSAIVHHAYIENGVVVFHNAVINPDARIGELSIINTSAVIEHDVKIGINCHIAPNATICGNVTIGNSVMVGVGTIIIQGVKITNNCIIGAGSVVTKDITKSGIYVGTPARKIN
jgi:UDP-perosamine 4-acetyltransferase